MELSRRDFFKAGGAGMGGIIMLKALDFGGDTAFPRAIPLKKKPIGEKTTICPYDGTGCGFVGLE